MHEQQIEVTIPALERARSNGTERPSGGADRRRLQDELFHAGAANLQELLDSTAARMDPDTLERITIASGRLLTFLERGWLDMDWRRLTEVRRIPAVQYISSLGALSDGRIVAGCKKKNDNLFVIDSQTGDIVASRAVLDVERILITPDDRIINVFDPARDTLTSRATVVRSWHPDATYDFVPSILALRNGTFRNVLLTHEHLIAVFGQDMTRYNVKDASMDAYTLNNEIIRKDLVSLIGVLGAEELHTVWFDMDALRIYVLDKDGKSIADNRAATTSVPPIVLPELESVVYAESDQFVRWNPYTGTFDVLTKYLPTQPLPRALHELPFIPDCFGVTWGPSGNERKFSIINARTGQSVWEIDRPASMAITVTRFGEIAVSGGGMDEIVIYGQKTGGAL